MTTMHQAAVTWEAGCVLMTSDTNDQRYATPTTYKYSFQVLTEDNAVSGCAHILHLVPVTSPAGGGAC
jgi:hypothetical protein